MGLEGIVSKRLDAPYSSGRGDSWRKAKCRAGHEVVLGGWTSEAGTLRSLLAGVNREGHLVYVGRIGTGYTRKTIQELLPKLKALTVDQSPFGGANAPPKKSDVRWLEPKLVAEIEFAGWTGSGMIRQAAFKGLRLDKPAAEVVAEIPAAVDEAAATPQELLKTAAKRTARAEKTRARREAAGAATEIGTRAQVASQAAGPSNPRDTTVMGVTISKPDKPLWPDAGDGRPVTKLDLARYFESIGPSMLPHLARAPLLPGAGARRDGGQQFFQRHAMAGMSDLFELVKVKGDRHRTCRSIGSKRWRPSRRSAPSSCIRGIARRTSPRSRDGWCSIWIRRRT